jgi:hypothetical protein
MVKSIIPDEDISSNCFPITHIMLSSQQPRASLHAMAYFFIYGIAFRLQLCLYANPLPLFPPLPNHPFKGCKKIKA